MPIAPSETAIEAIMNDLFPTIRTPRSTEYKAGVKAALRWRLYGSEICQPYPPGTAAADAYWAGMMEGKDACRKMQED